MSRRKPRVTAGAGSGAKHDAKRRTSKKDAEHAVGEGRNQGGDRHASNAALERMVPVELRERWVVTTGATAAAWISFLTDSLSTMAKHSSARMKTGFPLTIPSSRQEVGWGQGALEVAPLRPVTPRVLGLGECWVPRHVGGKMKMRMRVLVECDALHCRAAQAGGAGEGQEFG